MCQLLVDTELQLSCKNSFMMPICCWLNLNLFFIALFIVRIDYINARSEFDAVNAYYNEGCSYHINGC